MKKILVIGHSKGGVGKSTIAYNLAYSLLDTKQKVTIIDLDFQQTLFFISSINPNSTIEVLQPQNGSELISLLYSLDGYIVIDLGGFDSDINRIALNSADTIIVPVSNSIMDIIGFKTFEAILHEISPKASINILLNNIHPLTSNFTDIAEATKLNLENTQLLSSIIRHRKIYKDSVLKGKSIFHFFDEKAKHEIVGLRDEIIS